LEHELSNMNPTAHVQAALRSERAFGLQYLRESTANVGFLGRLLRLKTYEDEYLDLIDSAIKAAAHPHLELEDSVAYKLRFQSASPLVQELAPTLDADFYAIARLKAQISALRILNVLLRHRITGFDGAKQLTDLGLPNEVLVDPFNGQPIHIKQFPEGWVIYSVGIDREDDGGLGDLSITDVGLGPPSLFKAEVTKPQRPKGKSE